MITLQLSNDELFLLRNALHSFLTDFSHDEADVITRIQHLLDKVDVAREEASRPAELDQAAS
jgi:hypothetical protein